jgi:hypothetical protein
MQVSSSLGSQEMYSAVWMLKAHGRVHNGPLFDARLMQIHPVHFLFTWLLFN